MVASRWLARGALLLACWFGVDAFLPAAPPRVASSALGGLASPCRTPQAAPTQRAAGLAAGRNGAGICTRLGATPPERRYFSSIAELEGWESRADAQRATPLPRDFCGLPQRRRVLHCHDMQGGYRQSADEDYLATFSSWARFDIFVYFSHHRVVVPPHVWIEKSHQQQKIILGTFLFEGRRESSCVQKVCTYVRIHRRTWLSKICARVCSSWGPLPAGSGAQISWLICASSMGLMAGC